MAGTLVAYHLSTEQLLMVSAVVVAFANHNTVVSRIVIVIVGRPHGGAPIASYPTKGQSVHLSTPNGCKVDLGHQQSTTQRNRTRGAGLDGSGR